VERPRGASSITIVARHQPLEPAADRGRLESTNVAQLRYDPALDFFIVRPQQALVAQGNTGPWPSVDPVLAKIDGDRKGIFCAERHPRRPEDRVAADPRQMTGASRGRSSFPYLKAARPSGAQVITQTPV
jgi:hypothetical protein